MQRIKHTTMKPANYHWCMLMLTLENAVKNIMNGISFRDLKEKIIRIVKPLSCWSCVILYENTVDTDPAIQWVWSLIFGLSFHLLKLILCFSVFCFSFAWRYHFKNIFDFTTAGDWDCVAAVERLHAPHYSVDFIFLSFGIMGFIVELWNY